MSAKVRDTTTAEGKKFQKMLKELAKLEVRVGVFAQQEESENRVDLVDVAMFNELGTEHIPSRPFLRNSVDANEGQINSFLQSMKKRLLRSGSAEDVLKKIGVFQKGLIQEEIRKGDFVKNADATIQKKGSDTPLIDTGRMIQSIQYKIQKKESGDE